MKIFNNKEGCRLKQWLCVLCVVLSVCSSYAQALTWNQPTVVKSFSLPKQLNFDIKPQVVIDGEGNTTVIWVDQIAGNLSIWGKTRSHTGQWSEPVRLSAYKKVADPVLSVSEAGLATVVWSGYEGLYRVEKPKGGIWSRPILMQTVNIDLNSGLPSVFHATNKASDAAIAYIRNLSVGLNWNFTVEVIRKSANGVWGQPEVVAKSNTRLDLFSLHHVVVSDKGSVLVAWQRGPVGGPYKFNVSRVSKDSLMWQDSGTLLTDAPIYSYNGAPATKLIVDKFERAALISGRFDETGGYYSVSTQLAAGRLWSFPKVVYKTDAYTRGGVDVVFADQLGNVRLFLEITDITGSWSEVVVGNIGTNVWSLPKITPSIPRAMHFFDNGNVLRIDEELQKVLDVFKYRLFDRSRINGIWQQPVSIAESSDDFSSTLQTSVNSKGQAVMLWLKNVGIYPFRYDLYVVNSK